MAYRYSVGQPEDDSAIFSLLRRRPHKGEHGASWQPGYCPAPGDGVAASRLADASFWTPLIATAAAGVGICSSPIRATNRPGQSTAKRPQVRPGCSDYGAHMSVGLSMGGLGKEQLLGRESLLSATY